MNGTHGTHEEYDILIDKTFTLEKTVANHGENIAVLKTKINAVLWILSIQTTAIIGLIMAILLKLI